MKIVSVMTTSSSGGAEFAAVEMLHALSLRGHDTVLLTDVKALGRDTDVRVVPIELGPKLSRRTWVGLALRWPLLMARLWRALSREAPFDVLLVHYKKEQLLAWTLPTRLRRALVWAEWGPVPTQLRTGLPRRAYLAAARRAALVMAVSEGTRSSLLQTGIDPAKAVVVPNALRADEIHFSQEGRARIRASLGIPADAFVVGCISRFHPKKRNDVVVRAVAGIHWPDTHLILAGAGETEGELRRLAEPLDGRAHFIGTPGADVGDVLSAFDVSVFCPSPTEGAPRAVILGMLASRPCLATGGEGVADMITSDIGGIASPENDPDALRVLLERYLEDPQRAGREGAAARARAERTYAAPVVAELVEGLFDRAISSSRPVRRGVSSPGAPSRVSGRRGTVLMLEQGGRGGEADYTGELTRELAEQGWEVVLATAADNLYQAADHVTVRGIFHYTRGDSALGRAVRRARLGRVANGVRFLIALPRLLALAKRADLVHVQGFEFAPLGLIVVVCLRLSGSTVIQTRHNTFERDASLLAVKLAAWQLIARLSARTIVHTQADLVRLPSAARARSAVIPHGEYGGIASSGGEVDRDTARAELGLGTTFPPCSCSASCDTTRASTTC